MTTYKTFAAALLAAFVLGAEEPPAAFHELGKEGRGAQASPGGSARRQRAAGVNARLFDLSAAKTFRKQRRGAVRMNLFADVSLVVQWQNVERSRDGRSLVWSGTVEGQPLSQAIFVVEDGAMVGNIASGGAVYQIRTGADGEHWISEADTSALPPEGAALQAPEEPPADPGPVAEDASADDDGSTVDVLVVYTPAARQAAGGADRMRQLIQLGIAETNQGYANSRVNHRLRLVGSEEVAYGESGDFQVDLNRLSATNDGYLDEVHASRDRMGADLVSLWVERGNYCGLAWLLQNVSRSNPGLGFSVVRRDCATGIYTFGHELGHNLGADHAPGDTTSQGAYPYSHGFKQMAKAPYFRSVMAYDCPGGCPRINYWSSPDLSYQGSVIGTRTQNDNRTTLNSTAAIVASYRRSVQAPGGGTAPPASGALPESPHPYSDNFDRVWTYTLQPAAASIDVTFDAQTYVEQGWDFIVITDGNGHEIAGSPFTGNQLSGKYVTVPGSTVRIRLVTDRSETYYGFKVTSIRAAAGGSGRPDLVTVSFTASNAAAVGGKINGLVARVQNQGPVAAGAFRIGFYWVTEDLNATFSGWSCSVAGLGPGLSFACSGDIGVDASLRPGRYQLVAIADDQRQTADADWNNNARAADSGAVTLR